MFDLSLDPLSRMRETYPAEGFKALGLPGYAVPKRHGHAPKGANFRRYETIAKCWMENALLFHYRDHPLPLAASVILFTWVMPDGLGDWAAQHVTANILKKALPHLRIELVTLVDENEKRMLVHPEFPTHLISYKNRVAAHFPMAVLKRLGNASLILQLPTFYPHFDDLFRQIQANAFGPPPTCAHIGEYGFIDSEWFHPESWNMCMGLHPLEKGLLLHSDLLPNDVTRGAPFYFAYLVTKRGYATYLHALLKHNPNSLKLVVCNFLPLLETLKEEDWLGYGLKEIVLRDADHETQITLGNEGRTLIIECRQKLSSLDVQKLILTAENFVGCRGDRSFSEVVSLERFFFYDPPAHSVPFLHDLSDMTKFYCLPYPSLHIYLDALLDTKTEARELGHTIGALLSDPSLLCGMQRLIALIKSDFLFNPNLINFVKSKITHHFYPAVKESEETLFKEFLEGAHSLEELIYGRRT